MAKSGHTPDCVHCRFMVRQQSSEYRCRQHDMTLHTPVSLFCKNLTPKSDADDSYRVWFDETVNTDELAANTLYTWIETHIPNQQGETIIQIDHEVIAAITTYANWSAGIFWQVLRDVRQAKGDQQRQHGFDVED